MKNKLQGQALEEAAKKIQEHAQKHYEDGGWDVIVECWTLDETKEAIAHCDSYAAALRHVGVVVGVYSERQADAEHYRREAIGS